MLCFSFDLTQKTENITFVFSCVHLASFCLWSISIGNFFHVLILFFTVKLCIFGFTLVIHSL